MPSGELWRSALLDCLKTSLDMSWSDMASLFISPPYFMFVCLSTLSGSGVPPGHCGV